MNTYRDSPAYQRSNYLRPDGSRPRWPVTVEDYPSLPEAHARAMERAAERQMMRQVTASRGIDRSPAATRRPSLLGRMFGGRGL